MTWARTPYTPEQIRKGSPEGRCFRFQVFQGDTYQVTETRFLEVDDRGARTVKHVFDRDGRPAEPPVTEFVTWEEFRKHAEFPADRTTLEPGEVDCALGRHSCTVYSVRGETPSDPVQVFYFAKDRPGPPVRVVTKDGSRETLFMEMISDDLEGGA